MKPTIVVQCGAGSKPEHKDGAETAGGAGYEILQSGGRAIDAIEYAISILEDDERFNAGSGSRMHLDGRIQMDAGIMDSDGNCGAIACIMNVKNPIQVARKVADGPHILLAGDGAIDFARKFGFQYYDPTTFRSVENLQKAKSKLKMGDLPKYAEKWKEFEEYWTETVGTVAVDKDGTFATGVSTGGAIYMLKGRVGDSPLIGCGFYADQSGAVCATGIGEDIMEKVLSKWVYDKIVAGESAQGACDLGVSLFEKHVPIGIVAISQDDYGVACNRDIAWWASAPKQSKKLKDEF